MWTYLEELDAISIRISQEAALIADKQTDLCNAFAQIIGDGGVCRETGMLIARNVPSLESVIPTQFTLFPTNTSIKVAVEGFWSGIADGITKIFELIFSLLFGIIKLLVKPFEWLFGGEGGGATGQASSMVANMSSPEVVEVIESLDSSEIKVLVESTLDGKSFSKWDMRVLQSLNFDIFININANVAESYDTIIKVTDKFLKIYDTLDGGDETPHVVVDLATTVLELDAKLAKLTSDFFKDISAWDIATPDIRNSKDVEGAYEWLNSEVPRLQVATEPDTNVIRFYRNKLSTFEKYLLDLEESINFNKSDEELFKDSDTYLSRLEKQESRVKKLGNTDFEKMGLDKDSINYVKRAVNLLFESIKNTMTAVRVQSTTSIKAKRSIFKGVKMMNNISTKFGTVEELQKFLKAGKYSES